MSSYATLAIDGKIYHYCSLASLGIDLHRLPYSIRILLESVLRNCDGFQITEQDVKNLAAWSASSPADITVPFKPARVLLQDFTGVPAVVDLAAMRSAMFKAGGDPERINPLIPVDLVIDHSIQTDFAGTSDSLDKNTALELERNAERYALLHWGQKSLSNFRVVPPSVGIIHQVNLEFLADVVHHQRGVHQERENMLYPDSVLGTDSHTVMINGLGVLGWGVGGIEAEAVMLGQPYYMLAPQVVGMELTGSLPPGVTATDLVLTLTEMFRKEGVVGKFVEYFGQGAQTMPVADRAVLANMAPEYGATMGFFPVDDQTLRFLRSTGRDPHKIAIVESYCKAQHLFRSPDPQCSQIRYSKVLSLNLSEIEPCVAGPKRPQDRIPLSQLKTSVAALVSPLPREEKTLCNRPAVDCLPLHRLPVVLASITSCTNTSNPNLMVAAGLLAKKAVEKGLRPPSFVKTSLAPGSRAVTEYLTNAGLLAPLETLGFHTVGYGCMTCIGNSGPLSAEIEQSITEHNLTVAAVLSGNRNFEGRVHPLIKANYLASPPLVVAFALAGCMGIELNNEPLGTMPDGTPVFLADIFPTEEEIAEAVEQSGAFSPDTYTKCYKNVFQSNATWNAIPTEPSKLFTWNPSSTYIQEPPFCTHADATSGHKRVKGTSTERANADRPPAHCLALLGDSVTTDHISPAGSIKLDSPAGKFLTEAGVGHKDFNSYGSRRGNDRVMTRGTFANIRIRNALADGHEGGITKFLPTGEIMPIYDAAMKYKEQNIPLIILAGSEYGTGSSRDWAAKGTALLGVRAVIARSFERIHRGNLVGMGVLPLEFVHSASVESLNLTGEEEFTLPAIGSDFTPGSIVSIIAAKPVQVNGRELFSEMEFQVRVRIDTPVELQYYLNGGILPTVMKTLAE
jgi:aconitate hydratase